MSEKSQMSKATKIENVVAVWLTNASFETICEYAGMKRQKWLEKQDDNFINEIHEDTCGWATEYIADDFGYPRDGCGTYDPDTQALKTRSDNDIPDFLGRWGNVVE